MSDPLIMVLKNLYDWNVRHLNSNMQVSQRLLNTNDYIVNILVTTLSRRLGISFPLLNSSQPASVPVVMSEPVNNITLDSLFNSSFYEPVSVSPSVRQIQEGTQNLSFSNILNPIYDSCPISLIPFDMVEIVTQIRGCGHFFSREPINEWFRSHCRCPVCRFDVRTYVSSGNVGAEEEEEEEGKEEEHNNERIREYERTLGENATTLFNLLSNPSQSTGVIRDLSGNDFLMRLRRS